MYKPLKPEQLKEIKEKLNAKPKLAELSKGLELTIQEMATDGPLTFFIKVKHGKVIELSDKKKVADITFSAPIETWKKLASGEMGLIKAFMGGEVEGSFNLPLDKNPALREIVKETQTSFAIVEPETRRALLISLSRDSIEISVVDAKGDLKKIAENVIVVPEKIAEKVLRGDTGTIVSAVLRGKIKIPTGIRKLLKYRKFMDLYSILGVLQLISGYPLRKWYFASVA